MAGHVQTAAKRLLGPAEEERPCKFKICVAKKQAVVPKVPKVSQLHIGGPLGAKPPPPFVVEKLTPCDFIVAIDVETHEKVPRERVPWSRDQFGLQSKTTAQTLSTLRVIQLGWAAGASTEDMVVKEMLVRPESFMVSQGATGIHGITHATAESDGLPLGEALRSMVTDVLGHCSRGARLVSHNLPFDAGLIYHELGRAGLGHLQNDWSEAVRCGICTMDPDVGNWARSLIGMEELPRSCPVGLDVLVGGLVPNAQALLRNHHKAGSDAIMHLALCRELVSICVAARA